MGRGMLALPPPPLPSPPACPSPQAQPGAHPCWLQPGACAPTCRQLCRAGSFLCDRWHAAAPAGDLTRGVPVVGAQWILHPGGRAAVLSGTGLGCGHSLQHQISLASHRLLAGARGQHLRPAPRCPALQRPEPSLGAGRAHLLTKRKPTANPVPSGHARNSPRDAIF